MIFNIFKRVSELENEVTALRGLLYEHLNMMRKHVIQQEDTENSKTKTKAEKIAKRRLYAREYYQRIKSRATPEQIAKRKAYAKTYYQRRKEGGKA